MANYKDPKTWQVISNITLCNYSNIEKRLRYKDNFSNNMLIYYSLFIIINSLTAYYFPNCYNQALSEYFNVVLSIILLVYSLINNNSKYTERIINITKSINLINEIRRNINKSNIEEFKHKYYSITATTELRTEIDFFTTVKQLCIEKNTTIWKLRKKEDITDEMEAKIKNYISELAYIHFIQIKIYFYNFIDTIIVLIPIIIFFICCFIK